ncbi:GvpL/GvpF family gas vesicle protein [Streptomyces sp. E1N211]|uniref:GvpL/GvpF family gas vesicle protein n=1 Tax=Streptomyces sp. E1N211 TaxID=1851876 RepID=UPI001F4D9EAC|nr:GvpL/GvpF family gas vesicle protein [Streptomyces sp. E1N211]
MTGLRYVYAVCRPFGTPLQAQLTGVGGDPPRLVPHRDLVAVVSHVPEADFAEESLRAHLEDLDWLTAVARAHQGVIDALTTVTTPLPLRLGTVFRDDSGVRSMIEAREENFLRGLDRLEGRVEWGVKVYLESEPEQAPEQPAPRATLVRAADDDHVLVLAMHHIVSDGWSLDVLVRDLAELYRARREGRDADLPELPLDYADYALWQRAADQGPALDHWTSRLAGLTPLDLPTDHPRPDTPAGHGAVHTVTLPAALTDGLAALGRTAGTTPYMTVLAAFQAALAFHSGQHDIAVGTVVANRERAETEQLVGFFVNTLVMRGDFSDDPTPATLLARTRDRVLEAFTHQSLPFEKVVEALSPERDLARNPLVQVLYTHTETGAGALALGQAEGAPYRIGLTTAKFDLTLDLREGAGRTELAFVYRPDLFEEETVAALARHTVAFLEAFRTRPDAPLSTVDPLTAADRARLHIPDLRGHELRRRHRLAPHRRRPALHRGPGARSDPGPAQGEPRQQSALTEPGRGGLPRSLPGGGARRPGHPVHPRHRRLDPQPEHHRGRRLLDVLPRTGRPPHTRAAAGSTAFPCQPT